MGVDVSDERFNSLDAFYLKLNNYFDVLNDAFANRDIHFSWIDVNYGTDNCKDEPGDDAFILELALFENCVRIFGWGFCSTDSIVLGSALLPFGLIYPIIGISFKFLRSTELQRRIYGQLSLEISDVNGKPLECKCCDIDLLHLNGFPRLRPYDILRTSDFRNSECNGLNTSCNEISWSKFGDGNLCFRVNGVRGHTDSDLFEGYTSGLFLVRELSAGSRHRRKKCADNFFANRVLKLLATETNEFFRTDTIPIWQILLNFLYKESCCAFLSITNGNGDVGIGILKPLTVHTALLSVVDNGNGMISNSDTKNCKEFFTSKFESKPCNNNCHLDGEKNRKNKRHLPQNLTWSSFCETDFEYSDLDLAEVYFARDFKMSKKLKFLKCWIKQMKKSCYNIQTTSDGNKSNLVAVNMISERLEGFNQEGKEPQSKQFSIDHPTLLDNTEAFLCNLPDKIQHGLESEGVDLQILAERLVISSVHWLHRKHLASNNVEIPKELSADSTVDELMKMLLQNPKNLKEKRGDLSQSFQVSDPRLASGDLVREYELQIFLRMEILQWGIGEDIGDVIKQKLVKQVCALLEIVQFHVDGGFHGHMNLYEYVEKTIKSRYFHSLRDVVNGIYDTMDLLPFGNEYESPVILLNSEDSNQSWIDKQERDELAETNSYESVSVEDESSEPPENVDESPKRTKREEEHAQKISEARVRRERARRFASFTSWIPDLQRVWAPKPRKVMKEKASSLQKESQRNKRRSASCSVVCETPAEGKRHACSQGNAKGDSNKDHGSSSYTSVPKALFQDDR